ncbi:hypothetical protein Sru01_11680 [Sphaerisporangium rufum]|uniref:Acyl transferase domain-containing protein n=1 Tax=Sphaerisporangium rufum TaxID=1381558 RepID=A0A919R0J3_9ACTN|nr:type I polyketide synthase [Sphaerisporangium rufum]GII76186.1 hypothetical protein Sru01_11680 [Sphaerisporangium rufum]
MADPAARTGEEELRAARETIRGQREALGRFLLEKHEPIAIIGAGLRFPGGNDTLDGFAAFLRAGRSGIGPLPRDRWDPAATPPDDPAEPGGIIATGGGFLDRVDEFDARFFNISPRQAPSIDPQQRLLLETAWEALESAGLDAARLRHGNGGVYVGASPVDFTLELAGLADADLAGDLATGMGAYSLSGRLSYFLGWRGPSLTTDTACAASLTALHLAVAGLRRRETDVALCGAVNVLQHPRTFAILTAGKMLAPDGHCKTFDEAADGYARAEGCGVLVLKRFTDARRDGDTILALVRGTAIGQDGESAGLTAPNGTAQEAVMRAALADARLTPADIQYVEAHGTGTPLGDPIEMGSIDGVFGPGRDPAAPLTVGSLKSNLGHMEPAAGMGGIIKVLLQMREGAFFPHLMDTPSGRIPWDAYPVTVPRECRPWTAPVRRATVNGFGVAGAIGVAVLEQPPPTPTAPAGTGSEREAHVVTLSARSRPALARQAEALRAHLAAHPEVSVADVCRTRNTGRTHFRHRLAGVVRDRAELDRLLAAPVDPGDPAEAATRVALLFTGSGAQYPGMGAALYRRYPRFRADVDACDELFAAHLGRSITGVMFGRDADAGQVLAGTRFTHAALFTLEYALARLWLSFGVRPALLIGHSVGEIAAATVAGLFTLPDGAAFLAARAALIESVTEPGGMAAVDAPPAEIRPLIEAWPDLGVAADNSPGQCVISGGAASLAAATKELAGRGLAVTSLPVAAAFHSPLMAPLSDRLRAALAGVRFGEPEYTIVSTLTGAPAAPGEMASAEYWVRHLNETVNYTGAVQAAGDRGPHAFLEVGPSGALASLGRRCLPGGGHRWLSSLDRRDPEGTRLQHALAGLYGAGLDLDWPAVHEGGPGRRIALPAYAFDRAAYRLPAARPPAGPAGGLLGREHTPANGTREATASNGTREAAGPNGTRKAAGPNGTQEATAPNGAREVAVPDGIREATAPHGTRKVVVRNGTREAAPSGVREFRTRIGTGTPPYLADHTSRGRAFMPAAAYVEMLLQAADAVYGDARRPVRDIRLNEALFLDDRPVELRTRVRPGPGGRADAEIVSVTPTGEERRHVTATIAPATTGPAGVDPVITSSPGTGSAGAGPAGDGPTGPGPTAISRTPGTARELLDRAAAAGPPERVLDAPEVYAAYARAGLDYGPRFSRVLTLARHGGDLVTGRLRGDGADPAEHLPPPLLDGATHGLAALADDGHDYIAIAIGEVRAFRKPRAAVLDTVLRLVPASDDPRVAFTLDAVLAEEGEPVAELTGMAFTRLARRPPAAPRGAARPGGRTRPAPAAADPVALRGAPGPARRTAVRALVRGAVAGLLHIDDAESVETTATFLELGVDSLVAIRLKDELETALGLPLSSSIVFDHPSVDELTDHLDRRLTPEPAEATTR